jgi:NAD(P)-dependent dehydrogenase (short-subunit alcohol dehydrogenase family)
MGWTPDKLPDLSGKTVVITGGNGGLGLEAAKLLVGKGARVIITARTDDKAQAALDTLRQSSANADVDYVLLDLADLETISPAALRLIDKCPELHGIINNAGVMQTPERRTKEGWELQLATNHLGHFRLNASLYTHLEASGGRIVPVSSIAHKLGRIHLDDLQLTKGYNATTAYAQSKLANLMYALELQRRLSARGASVSAIPCHPGYAATNLQSAGVGMDGGSALYRTLYKVTNAVMAQSATEGAYPLVLAAAAPDAEPGVYYGPTAMRDMRGPVGKSHVADQATDEDVARKLWEQTEALVGPFFGD